MITQQTFDFLLNIKSNNNKNWFDAHKKNYEVIKKEAEQLAQVVHSKLDTFDQIGPYKLYRIYKDVRFSKDKTPYKEHLGISFHRQQPYNRGGFYIQIEPNNSFIAGGFWNPEPKDLLRIRKAFEQEAEITSILADNRLIANFVTLVGEEVKTFPKGFSKELERINLIKKKQFLLIKKFTDDQVMQQNFADEIVDAYQTMLPFYHYMTDVLITDANGAYLF